MVFNITQKRNNIQDTNFIRIEVINGDNIATGIYFGPKIMTYIDESG